MRWWPNRNVDARGAPALFRGGGGFPPRRSPPPGAVPPPTPTPQAHTTPRQSRVGAPALPGEEGDCRLGLPLPGEEGDCGLGLPPESGGEGEGEGGAEVEARSWGSEDDSSEITDGAVPTSFQSF